MIIRNPSLNKVVVTTAACLAVFLVCVEFAGISVALPDLAGTLRLNLTAIQWCVGGYLIAFGGAIILGGAVGDVVGHKRVLAGSTFLFLVGSMVAGSAHGATILIAGRILQGLGAAFIWPNGTSFVYRQAPTDSKSHAVSIMTGVVGIAMAAGPFLAGYLCHALGWRWFFYINMPLCVAIIICLLAAQTQDSPHGYILNDISEAGIFSSSLALLLIVLNIAHDPIEVRIGAIIFAFGVLLWWRFSRNAITTDWPIRELLKSKAFLTGCMLRALVNLSFYSFLYVSGLYLRNAQELSSLEAGLFFLPATIALSICSFLSAKLMKRYGERVIAIVAFIISLIGYVSLSTVAQHSTLQLLLFFACLGIGYGLLSPYLFVSTMRSAKEKHIGKASALFYMMSLIGSLIGTFISTRIMDHVKGNVPINLWADAFPLVMSACALSILCAALLDVSRHFKWPSLVANS